MFVIPIHLISRQEFLLAQLQERFPYKPSADIENCSRQPQAGQQLSFNSIERSADRLGIRHVGADSYGLPTGLVDLVHNSIVALGFAGEKNDRIRRSKFPCEWCTGALQTFMNNWGPDESGKGTHQDRRRLWRRKMLWRPYLKITT